MFDFFFGWPKASKCKNTIKRAQCRMRQLKNRSEAMVRYLRRDLAELIHNGDQKTAFKRVKQLIQDESLATAYELLDHFCEFILTQFSYIRRHKDCPDDINEAVSSLIFASARCGDIPELRVIRKLFEQRYGHKFATAAVELYPGNLVNNQLQENLSIKSVPDDLKYSVVGEIARDICLQPNVLAIEYFPEWQQLQEKDKSYPLVESDAKANVRIAGSKIQTLEVGEIGRDVMCVDPSISSPSDSFYLPESCLTDTYALVSTVQQYPSYLSYPFQKNVEEVEDFYEIIPHATSDFQNKGEIMALVPSPEIVNLPPYAEALVDYADDIDESQFSVSEDGSCQDQRLLKFRSSGLPQRDKIQFGYDESDMSQDESTGENSSIRSFRKSKLPPKKRPRRRSTLVKGQGIMDIGFVIYYQKPFKIPSANKYGTHNSRNQNKPLLEEIPQSSYPKKRLRQHSTSEKDKIVQSFQSQGSTKRKSFNFDMCDCSLDQPCYCCVYYYQDCLEDLSVNPKRGIRASHVQKGVLLGELCHYRPLWLDDSNKGMELVTIPQKPNRNCGTLTRAETAPTYSRALTMPSKWPKNCEDKILRTHSCPSPQPKHVHPKLPDYDEIVANFTSLKRERLGNKDCRKEQNNN